MRYFVVILGVAVGCLALSLQAQPPQAASAKPKFLDQLSVGDKIQIRGGSNGLLMITILTEGELRENVPTAEERRLYKKVQEAEQKLREQGVRINLDANPDELSDELKQVRKQHGSIRDFRSKVARKMQYEPRVISAIGEDYVAYQKDNQATVYVSTRHVTYIIRNADQNP